MTKLNKQEKQIIKNYVESELNKKPNRLPSLSNLIYDIIGNPTREHILLINACMLENYKKVVGGIL